MGSASRSAAPAAARNQAHQIQTAASGIAPRYPYCPAMATESRRRRSRSGQLLDAVIWGGVLGAAAGAVLGDATDGVGAVTGAVIGAVGYAFLQALATTQRRAGEPNPLWNRILGSAL